MNCRQFNEIPLEAILLVLGHNPTRLTDKEAWFLNPFRAETEASFKIDLRQNLWYLFSEGTGGTNIDFMLKYLKTNIPEVLKWATEQNFSFFHQQPTIAKNLKSREINAENNPNGYVITQIKNLENENLKYYLNQRGLTAKVYPFVNEVHFKIKNKNLYAVGFKNISSGWELRNAFYKGALLKKDISIIRKETKSNKVSVFEGFMDALSFIEMQNNFQGDLLIMNSIALLEKTKIHLEKYSEIHLFLDNDMSGKFCTESILKTFTGARDRSNIYNLYKDLNEFLLNIIN